MSEAEVHQDQDDPQEIVHWFDRPPVTPGAAELAALIAGSFAAGVLAGVGVVALMGRLRD